MKQLFIFLALLALAFESSAQVGTYTIYGSWPQHKRMRITDNFQPPQDTLATADLGSISVKNYVPYVKTPTGFKPFGGSGTGTGTGTTYVFQSPLAENLGVVTLPSVSSSIITGQKTAAYISDFTAAVIAAGTTNWVKIADSAGMLAGYVRKSAFDAKVAELQASIGATGTLAGMSDVNTAGVQNEYVMKFNTSTGKWEAKPDKRIVDFVITRSGAYNTIYGKYQDGTLTLGKPWFDQTGDNTMDTLEVFTGVTGSEFTLKKEPSSVISVRVNNVPVSEENYSVVGLLLTIIGYSLETIDKLIIQYTYPK